MLDEKTIAALEDILDKTRGAHNRLVTKLREAESEVENLRHEIGALENSAIQTAKAIDSLRLTMRAGSRSLNVGMSLKLDDEYEAPKLKLDKSLPRSNIQDLVSREFRRNNPVTYINQNRSKPMIHGDFEPISNRFSDRTITQSCAMLLRESGGPLHVNELYNLLITGGMKFKGNNPTISVAVSLSRNGRFKKVGPGTFDLVIREAMQAAS